MTAMAALQRGKFAPIAQPEITDIREVTRADLAHLQTPRPPRHIQTLRDNHHRVARAIASGMSNTDVAATCGISINRVSMYKADPAMTELIAHYRALITAEWVQQDTVIEYMKTNAIKAQAMISDKLDEAIEKNEYLPIRDLAVISELGFDRTGYGKVNKNINVNVDFAAKLEAARTRSARARDITPRHAPPLAPAIEAVSTSSGPRPRSAPAASPSLSRPPVQSSIFRRL